MKKTTFIFKSIMAIATITIFASCKKEIEISQNNLSGSQKVISAAQVVTNSLSAQKARPKGYAGSSTLGDSTSVTR
ncbi:MAG: hypothetical protein ABIN97_19355 [Ginsengibacter sp.]